MPVPVKVKYFNYRGHRYQIVYKTSGGTGSSYDAAVALRNRLYPDGVIKKTSDSRYAVGIR